MLFHSSFLHEMVQLLTMSEYNVAQGIESEGFVAKIILKKNDLHSLEQISLLGENAFSPLYIFPL